jgi:hypothetical protein
MSNLDPAHFYRGFQAEVDKRQVTLLLNPPDHNTNLYDLWTTEFSNFNKVNVCLSGGIDSQFVLSVMSRLKKDISVYIFAFVWEDCIFNSPDVTHAIRYCDRYGYKYSLIEIDYEKFLKENKHVKFCRTYDIVSPQIALQLHMLDYIENNDPTFLGCDIPLFQYDFTEQQAHLMNTSSYLSIPLPFLNYARINQKIIIKEIFTISPEIYYLGFKHFVDTTIKHKLVIDKNFSIPGVSQPLRKLFYSDLGADILPPLLKNTGFELLKIHLAKRTGVYNEFDLKYRHPLNLILNSSKKIDLDNFKITTKSNELSNLLKQFEDFCKATPDIKPIKLYNFIL